MAFVHLYTGSDGEPHFEDLDLPFEPADLAQTGRFSPKITGVTFSRQPVGHTRRDFHNTIVRDYIVFLSGESEVEVGGGEATDTAI